MGGGAWNRSAYDDAVRDRVDRGVVDFGHDDDVRMGRASGIHPDLDPSKVCGEDSPFAGKPIRESRDSEEHPNSLPVAVIFDVTGSMGHIPKGLQKKLARLMDVVLDKAEVKDPQVLVGAVGDSTCDQYPLQVGQFESDNRFDEQLRNIILEGAGGGQQFESYGLTWRFAAYHTATDSFEKRGKKGYFFTMGDESLWPTVTAADVSRIFGIQAEADETVEELLAKAQEQWEVYHLCALDGNYPDREDIHERWRELLGERYIMVQDSNLVCEVIAGIIHSQESALDAFTTVKDIGLSGRDAEVVTHALVPIATGGLSRHVAKGSLAKKTPKGKRKGVSRI